MRAAVTYVGNILVTHRPALSCRQDYSVSSLVLMFFTFSGIGWLWEVGLHLVVDGMFFNRGVMAGPWLPIYGTGGVLILVLLKKWRSRRFCLLVSLWFCAAQWSISPGSSWRPCSVSAGGTTATCSSRSRAESAWKGCCFSAQAASLSSTSPPLRWMGSSAVCPAPGKGCCV